MKFHDRKPTDIIDYFVDIVYFFYVDCSNPQGDPLSGNKPRRTPDGLGFVTKQGLSRKIRDTVEMRHGDEMMIVRNSVKSLMVSAAATGAGIDESHVVPEDDESPRNTKKPATATTMTPPAMGRMSFHGFRRFPQV